MGNLTSDESVLKLFSAIQVKPIFPHQLISILIKVCGNKQPQQIEKVLV